MTTPCIHQVEIVPRRISSAEADLLVQVTWQPHESSDTSLRLALIGPSCPGVQTVQVCYPLRCIGSCAAAQQMRAEYRGIIPEPTFYQETLPMEYRLQVELCSGPLVVQTIERVIRFRHTGVETIQEASLPRTASA